MPNYTENYRLEKPLPQDFYNVEVQNNNMEIIDQALKEQSLGLKTVIPTVTTSGTGSAFTVTVSGITELTKGLLLTVIPHTNSTSMVPTLNLNGLGTKTIKRRSSHSNGSFADGNAGTWLTSGKPQLLQYDGTYWITVGNNKPYGDDLDGVVGTGNGGTGRTSWTTGRLVYASSSSTLAQLAPPTTDKGFLAQSASGAPYWSPPATTTTHTLYASNWSGTEAPYTYNLSVSGVTATSNQDLLPGLSITAEQLEVYQSANIQDGGQSSGTLNLNAWGEKPDRDIPVRVIIRRDA